MSEFGITVPHYRADTHAVCAFAFPDSGYVEISFAFAEFLSAFKLPVTTPESSAIETFIANRETIGQVVEQRIARNELDDYGMVVRLKAADFSTLANWRYLRAYPPRFRPHGV